MPKHHSTQLRCSERAALLRNVSYKSMADDTALDQLHFTCYLTALPCECRNKHMQHPAGRLQSKQTAPAVREAKAKGILCGVQTRHWMKHAGPEGTPPALSLLTSPRARIVHAEVKALWAYSLRSASSPMRAYTSTASQVPRTRNDLQVPCTTEYVRSCRDTTSRSSDAVTELLCFAT